MVDVLLRHYPQLAPALNGVQNVSPLEKGAPLIASLLARGRSPGEWPIEQRSHSYSLRLTFVEQRACQVGPGAAKGYAYQLLMRPSYFQHSSGGPRVSDWW